MVWFVWFVIFCALSAVDAALESGSDTLSAADSLMLAKGSRSLVVVLNEEFSSFKSMLLLCRRREPCVSGDLRVGDGDEKLKREIDEPGDCVCCADVVRDWKEVFTASNRTEVDPLTGGASTTATEVLLVAVAVKVIVAEVVDTDEVQICDTVVEPVVRTV